MRRDENEENERRGREDDDELTQSNAMRSDPTKSPFDKKVNEEESCLPSRFQTPAMCLILLAVKDSTFLGYAAVLHVLYWQRAMIFDTPSSLSTVKMYS